MDAEEFDYVVVGGGSSGAVAATRLAQAGASVLVLEAGPSDRRLDVLIPAGVGHVNQVGSWNYRPEPDPSRNGRVDSWPAGKILGGGGSINATMFIRGNPADYDGWAQAGCAGWDFDSLLPRFKRMETWEGGASDYRGGDGPIAVGFHRMHHAANDTFLEAAGQAGHARTADYNGPDQEGVGVVQVNQRRGMRSHASREYLRRLGKGERLEIRTNALVLGLELSGRRATGVRYRHRGRTKLVRASQEVVLSTGAIGSPKLLMLAGIGPADRLRRRGVPVVEDLAGVGDNLQDHPGVWQRWLSTVPTMTSKVGLRDGLRWLGSYVKDGSGNLATAAWTGQVMHRIDPSAPAPELQHGFSSFALVKEVGPDGVLKIEPAPQHGLLMGTILLHPRQRGRIDLASASPLAAPVIDHQLLGDQRDLDDILVGLEEARRIVDQPALRDFTAGMFEPEGRNRTREEWVEYVRNNASPWAHQVGTCRMGVDDLAVVDPELRVRGIDRLRVVDASIMPTLTTGNTNATAMVIGEMGAESILADSRS